jgi:hypothetical protein
MVPPLPVNGAAYAPPEPTFPGAGGVDVGVDVDVELEGDPSLAGLAAEPELPAPPHDANLADYLVEEDQKALVSDLQELFDADLSSRSDWEKAYTDGLDLLGIKTEDRDWPWDGACGVAHPMILESAVRFQSKASVRLFPAKGPADVRVFGQQDDETLAAARRVADDLNYTCTEKMSEYFPDTEQLLFALPIAGSAFRKIYYDPILQRTSACFIKADDFVMPSDFANLETCPRYAHRMHASAPEIAQLQAMDFYSREAEITPESVELTKASEKEAELIGIRPASDHNEILDLIEMHTALDLPGFEDPAGPLPYVFTWESKQGVLLSIRRNWDEADPRRQKRLHFVHYRYVPGLSAYGYGLIHLIGGIAKSSTSLLRQLIDAGTLSNLPGGLKARTLRIKGDSTPIAPGEWRDVDVPGAKISDSLHPLPYKEPSQVLLALYSSLVQEGKEFASIADLDVSAASANAPVGTILALLERASEVITAVQARLHAAFKQELRMIADCIRRYDSDRYDYPPAGVPAEQKKADYARRWAIRPVSDPSSSTTAQRVMQLQAAMQFAQAAPQIYDIPALHRAMLSTLGIEPPEDLVPDKKAQPLDPVGENMAILNSKPVQAFEFQDHQSHIAVHMTFAQDGQMQQMLSQSPLANSVNAAMAAHIAEHVAFEYRKQIEEQLGTPLPPLGEPLPPEIEQQIAPLEAAAAQKLSAKRSAEQAQKKAEEQAQDPVFQLEQKRVGIEEQRVQVQAKTAAADVAVKQSRAETERMKALANVRSSDEQNRTDAAKVEADVLSTQAKLELENERLKAEVLKMRGDLAVAQEELDLKRQELNQRGGSGSY